MYKVIASIPILALGATLIAVTILTYIHSYFAVSEVEIIKRDVTIMHLKQFWPEPIDFGGAYFSIAVGVPILAFGIVLLTFGRAGRSLMTLQKNDAGRERIREAISINQAIVLGLMVIGIVSLIVYL